MKEKFFLNLAKIYTMRSMLYSMLKEILETEIAPSQNGLTDDLYGLQFGSKLEDKNLRKIIICLDPSKEVIKTAIKKEIHFIISHHGLFHRSKLYMNDDIIDRLKLLGSYNIDLFVMHTAWDASAHGVSETYLKKAGLKVGGNFYFRDKSSGKKKAIGRIGEPLMGETVTIRDIAENLKRNLGLPSVRYLGDPNSIIEKAAVVGGKGFDIKKIVKAKALGCDTVIGGEFNHPEYLIAREIGVNIIETTHYTSEKIGMESLQLLLTTKFPRDEFIFVESEDPVSYI